MKLRYYSEFKSKKEKIYRLEIHTALSTYFEQIKLSSDPVSVEYESNNLYNPTKLSNATISVYSDRVLTDLYTGENQGVQIRLYNLSDNTIEWFGYLTPNLYSSEYITDYDNIELQAVDTLSILDNVKYSYISNDGTFRSFNEVFLSVIDKSDPDRIISKVYIQRTNKLTKESSTCLFDETYIHERNFFDESNEPMTCLGVIEALLQYYGMSIIQWRDAYYIIDYDFINRGSYDFFAYNRNTGDFSVITLENSIRNVLEIGVAESSGSISLGDVFNKVSVVANMNKIDSLCPDLMDIDDLKNQNSDKNKYYISSVNVGEEHHTLLTAFFNSENNWTTKKTKNIVYKGASDTTIISQHDIDEITIDNIGDITKGAFFQKVDSYKNDDGEPSFIDWNTCLTFVDKQFPDKYNLDALLTLKKRGLVLFKGGYFLVNMTYRMSKNVLAHTVLSQNDTDYNNIKYHTQSGWKYSNTMIPCKLSIGDYYYNGEEWVSYEIYNNKVTRGYFETTYEYGFIPYDYTIYYYFDTYGYKRFVNETRYNSLPSNVQKASYVVSKDIKEPCFYYTYEGKFVYVTKEYHYECMLKDRFWLVHVNKEDDIVFEQEKQLTNTVSYRMNLINSEDAQSIKLPDFVLTGELEFNIYLPNELGTAPQNDARQVCNAFHITDLILKYTNSKATYDIFSNKSDDTDTVYSNVINDNNVTEMDDIELTVNSYSKGIASYSNAATKKGDKFDYIESVYNSVGDASYLPEQILIDKLFRHYCSPKFCYQNCLNYDVSILSRIKENSLKKIMVVDSMSINYSNDSCIVNLMEV